MSKIEIGCCGAYCKTCRIKAAPVCKGCKLGYNNGARDINKAKCKIKLCCFRDNNLETCTDCKQFETCPTLQSFYQKKGNKYKQYQKALTYIKEHGYKKFLEKADNWKYPFGSLK